MSVIQHPPSPAGGRYRFTPAEFWALIDQGFFRGRRVELIGGEIIEMAAQKNQHLSAVRKLERRLEAAFGAGY